MKVEVKRVSTFNVRNLVGHDSAVLRDPIEVARRSNCIWLGLVDGVEVCACGLIPTTIFSDEPYLWLIHTRICEEHPVRFIRWSRRVMDEILVLYPSVVGLCAVHNDSARAWLGWLGASFGRRVRVHGRGDFEAFRITRNG